MIHYTLLPKHDIDVLKREYRIRVFTLFLLLLSCSIVIGIGALIPAYIYSYYQEQNTIKELKNVQDKKESQGIYSIVKNLEDSEKFIKKLKDDNQSISFSGTIDRIMNHSSDLVLINSFQVIYTPKSATSSADIIIQGKSPKRESLFLFKKKLESDRNIYDIEMPISDLAKGSDIPYAIKLKLRK